MITCSTIDNLHQADTGLTDELLHSVSPEWNIVRKICSLPQGELCLIRNKKNKKGIQSESLLQFARLTIPEESDYLEEVLPRKSELTGLFKDAPNIVPVQDFYMVRKSGEYCCFLQMENMPSLSSMLPACEKGTVPESQVLKAALDICRALIFCQDVGLVHRSISPASIFIDSSGDYRLGYFDLFGNAISSGSSAPESGALSYVAPEQFSGRSCSSSVDLYSLGLVLYQLLNRGRMPFLPSAPLHYSTADIDAANYRRLHGDPLPAIPDADISLQNIIRKCCSIRPEERYPSAREFYSALLSCVRPDMPGYEALTGNGVKAVPQLSVVPAVPAFIKFCGGDPESFADDKKNGGGKDPVQDEIETEEYDLNAPESHIGALPVLVAAAGLIMLILGVAAFLGGKPALQICRPALSNLSQSLSRETEKIFSDSGNRALAAVDEMTVEIPDPVLKKALLSALGLEGDEIRISDTRNVRELILGEGTDSPEEQAAVTSLAGLESFSRLKKLSLRRMNISDSTDLSALTRLKRLRILNLQDNSLSSLESLENLRRLTWLDLSKNRITSLSPLQGMTNLKSLALYENTISDLSPLSSLTGLEELYLDGNDITDITPLSGLTELETLRLDNNRIWDISPLKTLSSLTSLALTGNQITDLASLQESVSIQELWLDSNPIGTLPDLSGMADLLYLNLDNTLISDLSGLSGVQSLEELVLSDNNIWDISPLAQLTGLVYLDLENNSIYEPEPLVGLDSLEVLYLGKNRITGLSSLGKLTKLNTLALQDNQIVQIDPLAPLKGLKSLDLSGNNISSLTALQGMTGLTWLNIGSNSVSDLSPIGVCTELETLQAYRNNITDLTPLNNLLNLKYLVLDSNSVSDLSALKNHQKLERLYIENNTVNDITVLTELKNLNKVYLAGNYLYDYTVLDRFPDTTDVYTQPQ